MFAVTWVSDAKQVRWDRQALGDVPSGGDVVHGTAARLDHRYIGPVVTEPSGELFLGQSGGGTVSAEYWPELAGAQRAGGGRVDPGPRSGGKLLLGRGRARSAGGYLAGRAGQRIAQCAGQWRPTVLAAAAHAITFLTGCPQLREPAG